MILIRSGLLALACVLCIVAQRGALAGDPEAGRRLAAEWCSICHYTNTGQVAGDAAPAFAEIANKPGATPEGWRTWLQDPHPPMPNLSLSTYEIDDLIAYISTLKSE